MQNKKVKECKDCDYDNAIRKGRAYYVCPRCGRDLTLELLLLKQAEKRDDENK